MVDLKENITQLEFGSLVGVSQPAVSDLLARGVLTSGANAGQWIREYCGNLRETAAGRNAVDGVSLATERAALARIQRQRIELDLEKKRGALIPVDLIEPRLRALFVASREFLRNQTFQLAQQVHGKAIGEIDALLAKAFDQFLSKLSKLPVTEDLPEPSLEPNGGDE